MRFFLTQRRWIIGLFAGFLTLLLLCGCESRNTVENASFLEYEYPQLGLIVELSYDRWKHPGSHHLSYVTVITNDHGCDHISISLTNSDEVIYSKATLRDANPNDSTNGPIRMQSRDIQNQNHSGYDHVLELEGPWGKPYVLHLATSQGTVNIDLSALKPVHVLKLGNPTFFARPYRNRGICL